VENSGEGNAVGMANIRLDNSGTNYNPGGGRAIISGRVGSRTGPAEAVELNVKTNIWRR